MSPRHVMVAIDGSDIVLVFDNLVDSRRAMKQHGIDPATIRTLLMNGGVKLDYPPRKRGADHHRRRT